MVIVSTMYSMAGSHTHCHRCFIILFPSKRLWFTRLIKSSTEKVPKPVVETINLPKNVCKHRTVNQLFRRTFLQIVRMPPGDSLLLGFTVWTWWLCPFVIYNLWQTRGSQNRNNIHGCWDHFLIPPKTWLMLFCEPHREMYNGVKTGVVEFFADLSSRPWKMTLIILHSRQEPSTQYGRNAPWVNMAALSPVSNRRINELQVCVVVRQMLSHLWHINMCADIQTVQDAHASSIHPLYKTCCW